MHDSNTYYFAYYITRYLGLAIAAPTLVMSIIVYKKKKDCGFLILSCVLGYHTLDSLFGVFGKSITAIISQPPTMGYVWLLLYLPSIGALAGWTILAFRKNTGA
jgi:hypothetical protein